MQGKVLVFFEHRKFGFIAATDTDQELFFHVSDVIPLGSTPPEKGQWVSFDLGKWKGKDKAINVRILPSGQTVNGVRHE
jgi:cold shock CspA family protein